MRFGTRSRLTATVFMSLAAATAATADVVEWVGYQDDCSGSHIDASFFHGDNWFNFVPPDTEDVAVFGSGFDPADDGYPTYLYFGDTCYDDIGCPNPVYIPGGDPRTESLHLEHGDWTFDFGPGQIGLCDYDTNPGAYTVRHRALIGTLRSTAGTPGVATLEVRNGIFEVEKLNFGSVLVLGDGEDGDGTLSVRDGAQTRSPILVVANSGTGRLELDPGSFVRVTEELRVAQGVGASGTVDIDGPWTELLTRDAFIGGWPFNDGAASGSITVDNAGRLAVTRFLTVGLGHPSTNGSLIVSGTGSEVFSGESVTIGDVGSGTIEVKAGALLQSFGSIVVGREGDGTLVVNNSSTVRDTFGLLIGQEGGAEGLIEIDGGRLEGGVLRVGVFGLGDVSVSDGGTVIRDGVLIGEAVGSEGTLTVDGAGSILEPGGLTVVGVSASGSLLVSGGGSMTTGGAGELRVGQQEGASGDLTVTGPGSSWNDLGGASIGGWEFGSTPATGTLSVLDGASMEIVNVIVGNGNSEAVGVVNIAGNGAELRFGPNAIVGDEGDGSVVIGDGGTLHTHYVTVADNHLGRLEVQAGGTWVDSVGSSIGRAAGSEGLVDVDGGTAVFYPTVGSVGDGTLRVRDGGQVIVPEDGQSLFGLSATGTGHLEVTGPGTAFTTTGLTVIGTSGDGACLLSDGAAFNSGGSDVRIAQQDGSEASVTVDDASWTGMNSLNVGGWTFGTTPANGSLHIRDGGSADAVIGVIGNGNPTATGHVTVENENSTLHFSGPLFVADEGDGTLIVADSASVEASSVDVGSGGGDGLVEVNRLGQLVSSTTITLGGSGTGVLDLDGGIVDCTTLEVLEGGCLLGEGTIIGDVVLSGGKLAPEGPMEDPTGIMSVDGDLDSDPAPELMPLEFDLGGPVPGDDHDKLDVSGNMTLGGNLVVNLIDGYEPAIGDTITLIEYGSSSSPLTGGTDFDCFTGLDLGDSLSFAPLVTPTDYSLVVGSASGNRSPVARPDSSSTDGDTPVVIDVTENDDDPDGDDARVFLLDTSATAGTATIESNFTVRYEPDPGFVGIDTFAYFVTDCGGGASFATVVIDVGTAADLPEWEPGANPGVETSLRLRSARPNPFSGAVEVAWAVPTAERIELTVHDVSGKKVATLAERIHAPGEYSTTWKGADGSGRPVAAGVYFLRLASPGATRTQRIVLLR